jgi:protease-4
VSWHDSERGMSQRPTDFEQGELPSGEDLRLLSKMFASYLTERKRARRWNLFFKLVVLTYVGILVLNISGLELPANAFVNDRVAALVDVTGVIDAEGESSAENVLKSLDEAFNYPKTVGVIVRLNTPGGSPVQSGQIYDGILRLKAEFPDIPTIALIEDICASGGYYIAVAADHIYANRASIVGSIGVRMDSFGLGGAIEKLGVERRSIASGEDKHFLDPFRPMSEQHQLHAKEMLKEIHQQFISAVKDSRFEKLKISKDDRLFSGLVWTGERSKQLGLIDDLSSLKQIVSEVLEADTVLAFTRADYSIESILSKVAFSLTSYFR